ncbi:tRNA pseudouridine(38-40) synthase TruA [Leptospira sp. GIMC2001]|uniref:tRNA pseudouridine(38-40) synthase TruA n=1 Tax=Leptospira sp. GIMC2001 TaxID=1513297 RepID=UPI00234A56EF|nr:tRNA pseudouridine(38-40) synthase TruA [Leptospira sp. GIMC2001]WCL50045.1 tRNA pseudouridine(38-40) synthase TruA [Leptospira sp. GIMC2001]
MPNYAILIEYDGTFFHGFQKQINAHTVQNALERALNILIKPKNHPLVFHVAGRTDTGVHATGIVCNFLCDEKIEELDTFRFSLNALAGGKVSCLGITQVAERFHSRFSCSSREYEFKILSSRNPHPLWDNRAVWIREEIDWVKVRDQLQYLVGEKDFRSVVKQVSIREKSSIREIREVGIEQEPGYPYIIKFRYRADSFLHNMIRILTGTLVDIGTGKINDRNLGDILLAGDRSLAGKTLPAHGLYFARAYYDSFPEIEQMYKNVFRSPLV